MLLFLQILEGIGWGEIVTGIIGFFVVLWAIKVGLPQQLFTTTSDLLEKRTVERDDALREKDAAKKEIEQLEEEIRTLRREIIQRMDISFQDQQTIKELRQSRLKVLGE